MSRRSICSASLDMGGAAQEAMRHTILRAYTSQDGPRHAYRLFTLLLLDARDATFNHHFEARHSLPARLFRRTNFIAASAVISRTIKQMTLTPMLTLARRH